jgi:Chalcone isomerase-like
MNVIKALIATIALIAGGFFTSQAHSAVVDINGIKFEDTLDLRGSKLVLNGAGTRYRTIIKVYAAGLYVGKKTDTLEEVISQPGPKRFTIVMLREADANDMGKLFAKGIEGNVSKSDFSKLINGLIRMGQIFADQKRILPGESFTFDWIPGTGTILTIKGKQQGEPFKEPEFFAAMMGLWLGKSPGDYLLRDALLGKKPSGSPNNN